MNYSIYTSSNLRRQLRIGAVQAVFPREWEITTNKNPILAARIVHWTSYFTIGLGLITVMYILLWVFGFVSDSRSDPFFLPLVVLVGCSLGCLKFADKFRNTTNEFVKDLEFARKELNKSPYQLATMGEREIRDAADQRLVRHAAIHLLEKAKLQKFLHVTMEGNAEFFRSITHYDAVHNVFYRFGLVGKDRDLYFALAKKALEEQKGEKEGVTEPSPQPAA